MPFLDIKQIKKEEGKRERVHFTSDLPSIPDEGDEIKLAGPADFDLVLTNVGDAIAVEGVISAELEVICSRCLENTLITLTADFLETFYDKDKNSAYPQEEDWTPYSGDKIDITPEVMNTILVNLPMRFICREDCKGLCSSCGINLNKGSCDCEKEELDPRLAKLKELVVNQKS